MIYFRNSKLDKKGKKFMNILAIGNSFSEDATTYLHQIAKSDGVNLKVANLFIGGCSLETHWDNILADSKSYEYRLNGEFHGKITSIKEEILEGGWDYITLQQASGYSGIKETYYQFITNISEYIKELAPKAKQVIHETWAYEVDSTHGDFVKYDNNQENMYQKLKEAYYSVSKDLGLPVIPCGDIIQAVRQNSLFNYKNSGLSLCRDGFHMHLVYGRYLTGIVWYKFFQGISVIENNFTF